MSMSQLCEKLVRFLDATVQELNSNEVFEPTVKALGSYVKNHKVNHHNIFDIIDVLWPTAHISVRDWQGDISNDWTSYVSDHDQEDSLVVYDITFTDGSSGIIVSARGLSIDFILVS